MARKSRANSNPQAVIYARVSSKEQEEEGFSIPSQLRLLREHATRQGLDVIQEFTEAETAKTTGRKAFEQMMRFLKERPGTAILVEKTDRLYRNFADFVKVDELGAILHFVKEGQIIRPDSHSSEKLMHSIKVCMAKNYVDNLSEEIRKGMQEKAMQGLYPSHAPLGYRNEIKNGRKMIVPDPERAPVIRRLFEEAALGRASLSRLAKLASDLGLTTKKGNRVLKSQLHKILRNEVYIGRIPWNGMTWDGIHEPLVSTELFFHVQELFSARTSRRGYGSAPIAYRGLVTCSHCGCLYAGEIKKGRYIYYHCCGRQNGCAAPYINEQILTDSFGIAMESFRVPPEIVPQLEEALRESGRRDRVMEQSRHRQLQSDIEKSKKLLARLYEDRVSGEVSVEMYRMLRDRYQKELCEAETAATRLEGRPSQVEISRALELLASAGDRFKQGDSDTRRKLVEILYSNSEFDGKLLHPIPRIEYENLVKAAQITRGELAAKGVENGQIEDWWR